MVSRKALEKYEDWCKSSEQVITKILEKNRSLAVAGPDEETKGLQERITEHTEEIARLQQKQQARKDEEEAAKTRLKYEAVESKDKPVQYALNNALSDVEDDALVADIRQYYAGKTVEQVVKEAFKSEVLDSKLAADEEGAFDFCRDMLEEKIRTVKRDALFKRYNGTFIQPFCEERKGRFDPS